MSAEWMLVGLVIGAIWGWPIGLWLCYSRHARPFRRVMTRAMRVLGL